MPKKKLLLLVLVIILLSALGGVLLWLNFNEKFNQITTLNEKSLTPELALQKIIQREIKQEFWPEKYEVITEAANKDIPALGLGRRFANNYAMEWFQTSDVYFLVIVGFDKKKINRLNGYSLNIVIKGDDNKGYAAAERYLKRVLENGWRYGKPKTEGKITHEISSILLQENLSERYIRVRFVSSGEEKLSIVDTSHGLPEVVSKLFANTNKVPKEYVFIHDVTFLSNHPRFGILKEVQELDHSSYK